jgi:hypothetical protein
LNSINYKQKATTHPHFIVPGQKWYSTLTKYRDEYEI